MLDYGLGCCIKARPVAWKVDETCFLLSFVLILADFFIARCLLKSLSIKQGIKYNAPESAQNIGPFITFYGLNVDEMLDPPDSFSTFLNVSQQHYLIDLTFNQFFYRYSLPLCNKHRIHLIL